MNEFEKMLFKHGISVYEFARTNNWEYTLRTEKEATKELKEDICSKMAPLFTVKFELLAMPAQLEFEFEKSAKEEIERKKRITFWIEEIEENITPSDPQLNLFEALQSKFYSIGALSHTEYGDLFWIFKRIKENRGKK